MTHADVRAAYEARYRQHDAVRAERAARSRRLSTTRGMTFLAAVGVWIVGDIAGLPMSGAGGGLLLVVVAAFAVQVVWHRRVRREERWAGALASLAREGLLRLDRDWVGLEAALPRAERTFAEVPPSHPYAGDLGIFGRASLQRLLGPLTSARARQRLTTWLLGPGTPQVARDRQAALRELAPLAEVRAEYAAHGRLDAPDAFPDPAPFLAWATSTSDLPPGRPWRGLAWGVPGVLAGLVVLDVVAGAGPWWLVVVPFQIWVFRTAGRAAPVAFAAVERAAPALRAHVPQMRLLESHAWEAPLLAAIGRRLAHGGTPASQGLGRLIRTADTVASRRNTVYATLAPLLLLDLHLLLALERWRARHGSEVEHWLDAAAEWEALAALATLAHDHPEWSYPEMVDPSGGATGLESGPAAGAARLEATRLAHPLLHPERGVANDVRVGPPGSFLLVTGSNMSGKSTLLRAIGLNAVLAGMGAPVAAERLVLPCFRVHTSMRIEDSLEEGVSLFMAELLRIRTVVEAARAHDPEGRPVLYLLDEMLHGTNTAERRVAARGIVRHLLDAGAVGAVSTHDLLLAETPELAAAADPVHFREDVEGKGPDGRPKITFDYRLRPGIATTRNALKLLQAVGLDLPGDGIPGGVEGGGPAPHADS